MRVDKYLKVSRLIKRRTIAKAAAEAERITLNGRIAKPSSVVSVGDRLGVTYGGRLTEVEVLSVDPRGRKGEQYFTIVRDEPLSAADKQRPSDGA